MILLNAKIAEFVTKNLNAFDPIFKELFGEGFGKIYANERKYFLGIFISEWFFLWLVSCVKDFIGIF